MDDFKFYEVGGKIRDELLGSYAGKATLGQDAYYCIICTKPDKDFKYKIFGNAYEGSISISKENYER